MKSVLRLRNHLLGATLLGTAAIFGWIGAADANTLTITNTAGLTTDTFKAEAGAGVPAGTGGFVGGTLIGDSSQYTFTYLGHGDSTINSVFVVGTNAFCSQAGSVCGAAATTVGSQFTVTGLTPGAPIPFLFEFGTPLSSALTNTLANGDVNNAIGAYLAQIGLGTSAFAGPGSLAFLGLSDQAYPTLDADFQDLTVSAAPTPLPAALPLFATGLGGLGLLGWRRKKKKAATLAA